MWYVLTFFLGGIVCVALTVLYAYYLSEKSRKRKEKAKIKELGDFGVSTMKDSKYSQNSNNVSIGISRTPATHNPYREVQSETPLYRVQYDNKVEDVEGIKHLSKIWNEDEVDKVAIGYMGIGINVFSFLGAPKQDIINLLYKCKSFEDQGKVKTLAQYLADRHSNPIRLEIKEKVAEKSIDPREKQYHERYCGSSDSDIAVTANNYLARKHGTQGFGPL